MVMEKGSRFKFDIFYSSICEHTIRGILSQKAAKKASDTLNASIDILLQRNPSTVTQWAEYLLIMTGRCEIYGTMKPVLELNISWNCT